MNILTVPSGARAALLGLSLVLAATRVAAQSASSTSALAVVAPAPLAPIAPSADDCSAPDVIVGTGSFAFDTTAASTGVEGQGQPLCNQLAAGSAILRDVWFSWTAPTTGVCTLSTCGQTLVDTKVAVYGSSGCPTAAPLACNDDNCGGLFQSTIVFPVTSGGAYLVQLGNYPGQNPPAPAGTGTFSIFIGPAAPNDDCAAPTAIAGTGHFTYDTTNASAGTAGQGESACLANNQTGIDGDVWFRWTSTFSGTAALSTCNGGLDSKIALYPGNACPPPGSALACNDDGCGFQGSGSRLFASVSLGSTYMIQVGQSPGTFGAASGLDVQQAIVPPNDDCNAAIPIAGGGPHAFDDTYASTGSAGQTEGLCNAFGNPAIAYDVWFTWTAPSSAQYSLSLCGNAIDTKVAIYAGTGCPTAGSALACNDDRCGVQSELCFFATAGGAYTIQIGTFPFGPALGGPGTFTIVPISSGVGHDDCIAPVNLGSLLGPFAYDTSSATTGCEGQSSGACFFFGTSDVDHDVWYTWTAPQTSGYTLTFCGTAFGNDTKAAVYAGAGCPQGAAIACNDDGQGCGLESELCFSAVQGATYTFQIGSFPTAPGGPGAFRLVAFPLALAACQHDNGTSENSIGWPNLSAAAVIWIQRFGEVGQTHSIGAIQTAYGSPTFPGGTAGNGSAVVAAVWDDPNDDGDPSDAVLLAQASATAQNVDTDVLNPIALATSVTCPGVFFVGVSLRNTGFGQFPAPLDQDGCPRSSAGRAWIAAHSSGTPDLQNLAANDLGLRELDEIHLGGVWLLRTDCVPIAGTPYCFGDGSGPPCPCSPVPVPHGAPGRGCPNSVEPNGALLAATGVASLGGDTLVITGSGMPAVATCLYFQGTATTNAAFGDGRRCVAGTIVRLAAKTNAGGVSRYPASGDLSISARSATYVPAQPIAAGQTRTYQCWYRNAQNFCVAISTFNLTNGVSVAWQP